jgi:hypothetical protein
VPSWVGEWSVSEVCAESMGATSVFIQRSKLGERLRERDEDGGMELLQFEAWRSVLESVL